MVNLTDTLTGGGYLVAPNPRRGTWANRMTFGEPGDMYIASDIGQAPGCLFRWNGARLVTPGEQILTGTAQAQAVHTGTLTRTAIVSVTIPGGLLGPNGYLTFEFDSTVNNTANTKLWQLTLGSDNLFHFGPSGGNYIGGQCKIRNRGSEASQKGSPLNLATPFTSGTNTMLTGTADTTVAQTLTLNATLADIGDTMTLQAWLIKFYSGA